MRRGPDILYPLERLHNPVEAQETKYRGRCRGRSWGVCHPDAMRSRSPQIRSVRPQATPPQPVPAQASGDDNNVEIDLPGNIGFIPGEAAMLWSLLGREIALLFEDMN